MKYDRNPSPVMKRYCLSLIPSLVLIWICLSGCRSPADYRNLRIDPAEKDMGYLSADNDHNILPFILGGYTKGPKSLVYSVPLLSWYVDSKEHKGFAFMAPFIVYDIDTISYWSDNRVAGWKNLTFWFLGLFGSTYSVTGIHRGEEIKRSSYWFFPLFLGGEDEEGAYFRLFMLIPL